MLALIAHDASGDKVALVREDTLELDAAGEVRYVVGEPRLRVYHDGPISLDDARALAGEILTARNRIAAG